MSQGSTEAEKLVGTGVTGTSQQGYSVKLSDDGNFMFVAGPNDNSGIGAVWFYQKVNGVWTQVQKIVPTENSGAPLFGYSLAVDPSLTTLIVGAFRDDNNIGASFVFASNGTTWTQQAKLVGSDYSGSPYQGWAIGLSTDANTAIVGGRNDASSIGAAWIFVRNGTAWSQQGEKLVANDNTDGSNQGYSVAITSDGNLVIVGGRSDNSNVGAIWVYLHSAGTWSQVGSKITATDETGSGLFGVSLALSGDDQWLVVGGYRDNSKGAVWTFKRNGTTFQQFGKKLVGVGSSSNAFFGTSVATNKIGSIIAVGGNGDSSNTGAVWVFVFNGTNFNQLGNKTVATDAIGSAQQGISVSLDTSGSQLLFGGHYDNGQIGAAWIYTNTIPTSSPTIAPTLEPTVEPTVIPSEFPTIQPSVLPTIEPTWTPTESPTILPTDVPTFLPTELPTITPTWSPTELPTTAMPSTTPTITPSFAPIQATSNKLSSAGIAGIVIGAVIAFGSMIWIVAMLMKCSEKTLQQEKSTAPDEVESDTAMELKI